METCPGAIITRVTCHGYINPTSRILFGTWWIFITIVTAFYTAQLTVVLSSPSFNMKVYSMQQDTWHVSGVT